MATLVMRSRSQPEELLPRRMTPIRWWAGLGAAILVFATYLWLRWIMSGPELATFSGPMPGWMRTAAHLHDLLSLSLSVVALYIFVVKPIRRTGRLSTDGMFVLALASCWWQDAISSYFVPTFIYNGAMINAGSWFNFVPGFLVPNMSRYPEPFVFGFGLYVWAVLPPVIFANWVMGKARRRWPRLGPVGLAGIAFLILAGADALLEGPWALFGMVVWPAAVKGLTLFSGHYYQFPLYESVVWGLGWASIACIRFFRNDRGEMICERGIEHVRATPRQRTWLRFLALAAVLNVSQFVLYSVPITLIHVNGDPWPEDILKRPYFSNGICGPGTTYACPGPAVPIPRPGSSHVDPNGNLATD